MIPTNDQIKAAFKQAKDDAKEYINSDELFNTFYELRTKYHLHVDVAGNLALLIDAVILEMMPLAEFPAALKQILTNVPDADYQAILKSVNDDVFVAFRTMTKEKAEAKVRMAKEEAERKAREEAEDKALEDQLRKEFEERAKAQGVTPTVEPPPNSSETTVVQAEPEKVVLKTVGPSILEQKVSTVSAPAQQVTSVPPVTESKQAPATPPRYHGSDPYREPAA